MMGGRELGLWCEGGREEGGGAEGSGKTVFVMFGLWSLDTICFDGFWRWMFVIQYRSIFLFSVSTFRESWQPCNYC
jgi:hypothetical protein